MVGLGADSVADSQSGIEHGDHLWAGAKSTGSSVSPHRLAVGIVPEEVPLPAEAAPGGSDRTCS